MGIRLRPQSSAWLAPAALAAQLKAQEGAVQGEGIASIGTGLARGFAVREARIQREADRAQQESHFNQLTARQEKRDALETLTTKLSLMDKFANGKVAELEQAKLAGDEAGVARLTEDLRTAAGTHGALMSQLLGIATKAQGEGQAKTESLEMVPGLRGLQPAGTPSPSGDAVNAWARGGTPESAAPDISTVEPPQPISARMKATRQRAAAIAEKTAIEASMKKATKVTPYFSRLTTRLGQLNEIIALSQEAEDIATKDEDSAREQARQIVVKKAGDNDPAELSALNEDAMAQGLLPTRRGAGIDPLGGAYPRDEAVPFKSKAAAEAAIKGKFRTEGQIEARGGTTKELQDDAQAARAEAARLTAAAKKAQDDKMEAHRNAQDAARNAIVEIRRSAEARAQGKAGFDVEAAVDKDLATRVKEVESAIRSTDTTWDRLVRVSPDDPERHALADRRQHLETVRSTLMAEQERRAGEKHGVPTPSANPLDAARAEYDALPDEKKTPAMAAEIAKRHGVK